MTPTLSLDQKMNTIMQYTVSKPHQNTSSQYITYIVKCTTVYFHAKCGHKHNSVTDSDLGIPVHFKMRHVNDSGTSGKAFDQHCPVQYLNPTALRNFAGTVHQSQTKH